MAFTDFLLDPELQPLGWFDRDLVAAPSAGATDHPLNAGSATYALTGAAASVRRGLVLAALAGAYALTGAPAKLVVGHSANAGTATYSITGAPVTELRGLKLNAASGSYAISGVAATFQAPTPDKTLAVDPGSYALSGFAAGALRATDVVTSPTTYAVSGAVATLRLTRVGEEDPTLYQINGAPAQLVYSGAVAVIVRQIRGNRQIPRFRTRLDDSGLSTDS